MHPQIWNLGYIQSFCKMHEAPMDNNSPMDGSLDLCR
jgi:hypothetical protein